MVLLPIEQNQHQTEPQLQQQVEQLILQSEPPNRVKPQGEQQGPLIHDENLRVSLN